MLMQLEPHQFDEWMAAEEEAYVVTGGNDRVVRTVAHAGSAICSTFGGRVNPEDLIFEYTMLPKKGDSEPGSQSKSTEEQHASPNQMAALVMMAHGAKG